MKRTKIVTAYWMDIDLENTNNKWMGSSSARKQRYLGSLIYHCKGFNCPIICYTHERSLNELTHLKNQYNLNNLTIKIKELNDIKYTAKINSVANLTEGPIEHLYGRPPQVMWGKFDVIREECTEDVDFIYWIDAGLQAVQLFPKRLNPYGNNEQLWQQEYNQFDYTPFFNSLMLQKLNDKVNKRFVTCLCTQLQDSCHSFGEYHPVPGRYPIAGFFGGDKERIIEYCEMFDKAVDLFVEHKILCFEQAIMKYVTDHFPEDKLMVLPFDTHQTGIDADIFHYAPWSSTNNLPKPLYRLFEEILEN